MNKTLDSDLDPRQPAHGRLGDATVVELVALAVRAGFDGGIGEEMLREVDERLALLEAALQAPPGVLSTEIMVSMLSRVRATIAVAGELLRREIAASESEGLTNSG